MSDDRIRRAQTLHWEIEHLESLGAHSATLCAKHREIARIYEEGARLLVPAGDLSGWTDLFAGVTHWGEAGEIQRALSLTRFGQGFAGKDERGVAVRAQLAQLLEWLQALRVVPSLAAYARPLPPIPRAA